LLYDSAVGSLIWKDLMDPRYKALAPDLYKQLLDKETQYQASGAELVRIALAGIALLGFYIQYVEGTCKFKSEVAILQILGTSVVLFAGCVAAALFHRVISTDGFLSRVTYIQYRNFRDTTMPEHFEFDNDLKDSKRSAEQCFVRSKRYFQAAIAMCIAGTTCVVAAVLVGTWFDGQLGKSCTKPPVAHTGLATNALASASEGSDSS
jgi:hypothetical protein